MTRRGRVWRAALVVASTSVLVVSGGRAASADGVEVADPPLPASEVTDVTATDVVDDVDVATDVPPPATAVPVVLVAVGPAPVPTDVAVAPPPLPADADVAVGAPPAPPGPSALELAAAAADGVGDVWRASATWAPGR